jgi:hypothetical protein
MNGDPGYEWWMVEVRAREGLEGVGCGWARGGGAAGAKGWGSRPDRKSTTQLNYFLCPTCVFHSSKL